MAPYRVSPTTLLCGQSRARAFPPFKRRELQARQENERIAGAKISFYVNNETLYQLTLYFFGTKCLMGSF